MTLPPDSEFDATCIPPLAEFRGSLAHRVYQGLKQAILMLKISPGAVLRKQDICEHLGVSRQPVSDAITRLASEGLVAVTPQSGSRVTTLSISTIREASFLRQALEVAAIQQVARTATEPTDQALTRNLHRQRLLSEDGDLEGFFELDDAFHRVIHDATGFPRVAQQVEVMGLHLSRARRLALPVAKRMNETIEDHEAIVKAVRDRNPENAQRAMARHLDRLSDRLSLLSKVHPGLFQD